MTRLALLLVATLSAPILPAQAEEGTYLPPVTDTTVTKECGACHMVFPPQFLPARSWRKLMADLASHFGEDASLAGPARQMVTTYLLDHAADAPGTKGSQRFLRGLSADVTPLRISETPFWQNAHEEVSARQFASATVKSPANCVACHTAANRGDFSEPE